MATDVPGSGKRYSPADDRHLLSCIEASERARDRGNFPFSALLVDVAGEVALEAENTVMTARDCTAHAELNLMRMASTRFARDYLGNCTLYTSAEPCAMCAGAIYWGNIRRVVFALSLDALGDILSRAGEPPTPTISCREVLSRSAHRIDVVGPHREADARAVHERFWGAAS